MIRILIPALIFALSLPVFAGTKSKSARSTMPAAGAASTEPFSLIGVDELVKMQTAGKNVSVFDANNEKTRAKEGLIAGAHALSSYDNYDIAKELPKDKSAEVVFYCANTQCMASHDAAKRAAQAGFTKVYVMKDGIQGWKKAGKPTEKFQPAKG